MVRYGTPVRVQAALSPNSGDEAVAGQGGVGWPLGILREYPFLGADAVDQRCPTDQYEKECDRIPFLQVVPDVCKYVREVHRVAEEPVGPISTRPLKAGRTPKSLPMVSRLTRLRPAASITNTSPVVGDATCPGDQRRSMTCAYG